MTRRITISVPDDIADRLERETNVSAYVTEAVRRMIKAERTRKVLTDQGFDLSAEIMAEARERYDAATASNTTELQAEALRRIADASRGRLRPRD